MSSLIKSKNTWPWISRLQNCSSPLHCSRSLVEKYNDRFIVQANDSRGSRGRGRGAHTLHMALKDRQWHSHEGKSNVPKALLSSWQGEWSYHYLRWGREESVIWDGKIQRMVADVLHLRYLIHPIVDGLSGKPNEVQGHSVGWTLNLRVNCM